MGASKTSDHIKIKIKNRPSSPTQALSILRICQTPTSTHPTIPPTNLLPVQTTCNSPSVASSIQLFDSLDNPSQTLPRRNSQSSPLARIEEALNDIKADNKEFKVNSAQNAETLKNHSITLTTHGTSLAALLEAQNKQQLEINQLKESNSTLAQDFLDQTLRITQLEETIEALMNTTESLTSQNQILQTAIGDLETLKTQVATQNEQIEALTNESSNN